MTSATSHDQMPPQPTLTPLQYQQLLQPIAAGRVLTNDQGQQHLAGWDVKRWLTRIFGFTGWDTVNVDIKHLYQSSTPQMVKGEQRTDGKGCPLSWWTVVCEATVTLVVRDQWGRELARRTDVGSGDGPNQPNAAAAFNLAAKAAVTDALKRAASSLGDQFGLSLYAKGSAKYAPAVISTLAPPPWQIAAVDQAVPTDAPVSEDSDETVPTDYDGTTNAAQVDPVADVLPQGDRPTVEDPAAAGKPEHVKLAETLAMWLLETRRPAATIRETSARLIAKYPDAKDVEVRDNQGETLTLACLLRRCVDAATAAETAEATQAGDVTRTPAGTPTALDCGCNAAQVAQIGNHGPNCTRRRRGAASSRNRTTGGAQ